MPKQVTRIQLSCLCCGKGYEAHAYRASTSKYCSRACYQSHRWRQGGACAYCGAQTTTRFCCDEHQRLHWNEREHERRPDRRAQMWARKIALLDSLGGKCVECGISDPRVLDIDHIDPAKKLRPVHRQYSTPIRLAFWEKEAGNLRILCANCHRIRTHRDTWKTCEFFAA